MATIARIEDIPLNSLLLDKENARHGVREDQTAILKWMASQTKVMTLAQSIAEHGLNPGELPLVIPAGDEQLLYLVVEGNRRIAALKMLQDPEKCPDETARRQFRKLRKESLIPLPTELRCVVLPDLGAAAPWIKLRHLGEQNGAGTVPWGAKENEFFAKRLGQRGPNEASMKLLEYAEKKGLVSAEESEGIPLTNVTRLINSPNVRRELGMNLRKGEPHLVADWAYFDRALGGMLRALASGHWTVSRLKSQGQRESFIKQIKEEQQWGSYEVRDESPVLIPETDKKSEGPMSLQGERNETKKKMPRDPLLRKTAVPSSVQVKIRNTKMLAIFRELKQIDVDLFVNASAVLTRVFIEGCVDLYSEKNGISTSGHLADKVGRVRNHLLQANNEDTRIKNDLKGLETFSGSHMSIGSANTFNAIVHNPKFSITARELKENWNRLEHCLPWFEGHI